MSCHSTIVIKTTNLMNPQGDQMKKLLTILLMLVVLSSFAAAVSPRLWKPSFTQLMVRDYYTGSEYGFASENSFTVFITLENEGCGDYKELKITLLIYDLDFRRKFSSFDLCHEDRENFRLPIDIPYGTEPGEYPVRITISNDDVTRVKHRWIVLE